MCAIEGPRHDCEHVKNQAPHLWTTPGRVAMTHQPLPENLRHGALHVRAIPAKGFAISKERRFRGRNGAGAAEIQGLRDDR